MDAERFDRLAKFFPAGTNRRRLLVGALLGGAVSALGGRRSVAACLLVGNPCARSGECCANARCAAKTCVCRRGHTICAGRCRDLGNSTTNCGRCGNRCSRGERCAGATCTGSATVTFASDPTWQVFDADPATGSARVLGLVQNVCAFPAGPPTCPAGATVYSPDAGGTGWNADLARVPGATWIWAPGITGDTFPAAFAEFFFAQNVRPGRNPLRQQDRGCRG